MFDAKRLLDALVGAASKGTQPAGQQAPGQARPSGQTGSSGLGTQIDQTVRQVTGQSSDQLLQKAKTVLEQNPGLAQAGLLGLAGLLFGKRKPGRGVTGSLAKLGGLALIGTLAYKAYQNRQAGRPLLDMGGGTAGQGTPTGAEAAKPETRDTFHALEIPQESRFHPVSQTEDDVLLYLRAMVAAASADGRIDEGERSRILRGLDEAGIDPEATRWLDRELASPADVEELAANVTTPERAAQVYAAARIAIDPDTIQEREFLRQLASSLDLDQSTMAQIDETAAAMKAL